jgi:hypothetical protein
MKVLDVTGCYGDCWSCGGRQVLLPADTNRPRKMRLFLQVARLTTLVLLRYTSAGATREDTCFRFVFSWLDGENVC